LDQDVNHAIARLHIAGPDQASIEFRRHLGKVAARIRAVGSASE
jgi:hypothetical protein